MAEQPDIDALALKAQAGDRRAADRLVMAMERTVKGIARDWERHTSIEDLEQEGRWGVADALKSWLPGKGSFQSFARDHIWGRVSRYASYNAGQVKLTSKEQEVFLGGSGEKRAALNVRLGAERSLQDRVADGSKQTFSDVLGDMSGDPEEKLIRAEEIHQAGPKLKKKMKHLTARERRVLRALHLTKKAPPRLVDLAKRIGCNKERVRQAGLSALSNLAAMFGQKNIDALALTKELRSNERTRRKAKQREFTFLKGCKHPDKNRCRFCKRLALPERLVCERHQWRREKCPVCKGLVPYREVSGRQLTYCSDGCKNGEPPAAPAGAGAAGGEAPGADSAPASQQLPLIQGLTPAPSKHRIKVPKPRKPKAPRKSKSQPRPQPQEAA